MMGRVVIVVFTLGGMTAPPLRAQPAAGNPLAHLLASPTFPKDLSDEDRQAIEAVRQNVPLYLPSLVQELLRQDQHSPKAFYLVGYLRLRDQETVMTDVVAGLPVGSQNSAYEPFLRRLIPFDKPELLARVTDEIRTGAEARATVLAESLAEAGAPNGTALLGRLIDQAGDGPAWTRSLPMRKALEWATGEGVGVDILVPQPSFTARQDVVIGVTLINKSSENRVLKGVPGRWFSGPTGLLTIARGPESLPRRGKGAEAGKFVPITLRPDERFTHFFKPDDEFRWPSEAIDGAEFTVRLADEPGMKNVTLRKARTFRIDPRAAKAYQWKKIASAQEWLRAEMALRKPPSARRLAILRSAVRTQDVEQFWSLAAQCQDVWALCGVLEEIPPDMHRKAPLLALVDHPNLAVRRAAIRALAGSAPDQRIISDLRTIIARQPDVLTRSVGQKTLDILTARLDADRNQ